MKPFYAVKCNPEPLLLNWLHDVNAGFDCASAREIALAPHGSEILYANPCKKIQDVAAALSSSKVPTTVVDSVEEVEKLASLKWPGDALIRLQVDDKGSTMPFSSKFGAPPSEVGRIADAARVHRLPLIGMSFHVGSGCYSPDQYTKAIYSSYGFFPFLKRQGHAPTTIDIGGGFTGGTSFYNTAKVIRACQNGLPLNLRMVAEPGRFFAETTHDLFTQVIGKKKSPTGNGWAYTIDESLYGQFSCIPFDHAKPKWLRVKKPGSPQRPLTVTTLLGRTCDSVDRIATAQKAEELEVGDWLYWPNMGAYTTVTATEFNGFPRPPVKEVALPNTYELVKEVWPELVSYVRPVQFEELK